MTAVSFENVSFWYPRAESAALKNVTLQIDSGSFVVVAGPTGCGKSTLLRAFNGLVPHFSGGRFEGRVVTAGRDTLETAPRHLAGEIAFVPQDPGASFVLDRVDDEIAYAMENLGLQATFMRTRVEEMLHLLGLEALRHRSVGEISGGERQRVAIAAALSPGAGILVLDEPTSQLDPQGAEDVLSALQRLVHDHGMTVVAAEHRLERVAGFADVVVGFSSRGNPVAGPPAEILEALDSGPAVARLGRRLGWKPVPLTVRDARRLISHVRPETAAPRSTAAKSPRHPRGLWLEAVAASYGGASVLGPIDLSLAPGSVTGIIGRNGAGKTTLLRCAAGLHAVDRGRVEFDGHPPVPGRDVALCPQNPDMLLFAETATKEIDATLRAAESSETARRWLDALGLSEVADNNPRDLSAGERALVAIAAVASTGAPILALDEPTRGLDPDCKARLVRFLRQEAETGKIVLLATHDVELAAECAERVILLAGGRVIADGAARDVMASSTVFSPQIARVFDGEWLTLEEAVAAVRAGRGR